jgi:hypothetical protein
MGKFSSKMKMSWLLAIDIDTKRDKKKFRYSTAYERTVSGGLPTILICKAEILNSQQK